MATAKRAAKKHVLTRGRAKSAAKKAKSRELASGSKKTPAWEKGGKQWSRVLGHFGLSA